MNRCSTALRLTRLGNMTNEFSEIAELPEFKKDFKKLLKRFHTLDEDLQNFISAQLIPFHKMGLYR